MKPQLLCKVTRLIVMNKLFQFILIFTFQINFTQLVQPGNSLVDPQFDVVEKTVGCVNLRQTPGTVLLIDHFPLVQFGFYLLFLVLKL